VTDYAVCPQRPADQTCCSRRSRSTKRSSTARPNWWPPMPASSAPRTRRRPRRRASRKSPSRISRPAPRPVGIPARALVQTCPALARGAEGRISVLKRRHRLSRCRYHGSPAWSGGRVGGHREQPARHRPGHGQVRAWPCSIAVRNGPFARDVSTRRGRVSGGKSILHRKVARVRLSTGAIIQSTENIGVPERGFVPGGPISSIGGP